MGIYCKYKQYKEFIVMCISKHLVHVEKVQNVNFILKNYNFKNIIYNCIISCVCNPSSGG